MQEAVKKAKTFAEAVKGAKAEIAKMKMPDLTAADLKAAIKTIAGTARSMGVEVED